MNAVLRGLAMGCCVMLLTACGGVRGAAGLAGRADDWPPLGFHRAQLMNVLGPAELQYTMKEGKWRELMTWKYSRVDNHPLSYVPIVGIFVTLSGEGATGEQRSLTVELDADGQLVSRSWVNETLVWEPLTNAPEWRPAEPRPKTTP